MESGEWLIDGGVVDNNPSLIAYVEAKKLFGADRVKVLSIGSGVNKKESTARLQLIGGQWGGSKMTSWAFCLSRRWITNY